MSTKARTTAETAPTRGNNHGLVATFQDVTDGFMTLAKTHIELAKAEARHDVKTYGKLSGLAAAGGALALLGFGFLNLAGVLFATLLGGLVAGVITAAALSLVYLVLGGGVALHALGRMRSQEGAMNTTKNEIRRSGRWVKQIADNS